MAQRVVQWQANDGTLHQSEEQALEYERQVERVGLVEDLLNTMDSKDLLPQYMNKFDLRRWIIEHRGELFCLLHKITP